MNERIKELANQCWESQLSSIGEWYAEFNEEKFAELLLKDFLSELESERHWYTNPGGYEDDEYYIRCAAKLDILDEVIGTIKHRYGLK